MAAVTPRTAIRTVAIASACVVAAAATFTAAAQVTDPQLETRTAMVGESKPQRIMSLSLCTDLLLLQLVPKERIASITYLAHPGVEMLLPGADEGVAINHGTAEDIINHRPDLILASNFSTPTARRLSKLAGARVEEIEDVSTFPEIAGVIRKVATLVGEPGRGEALVAEMNATLADLERTLPARKVSVVSWSGGDSVPGKGTLSNAIIEAAGAENIAATPGYTFSTFGVEQLLAARPDVLMYGGQRSGIPSMRSDQGQHRVVRQIYQHRRVSYSETAYSCGLPQSADAALDLRRQIQSLSYVQAMR